MITVRTLREDESFPQHLNTGFESMPVMNDYVWVAESGGHVIGALLAAPCHGLIFMVRLKVEDNAPAITTYLLLRHFVRDSESMGFKGYFTYIDPAIEVERNMIPICRKAGGVQVDRVQVPLAGVISQAARY